MSPIKTCENGHEFFKSSDCPVCPECEDTRKPDAGFLAEISAPARRASGVWPEFQRRLKR